MYINPALLLLLVLIFVFAPLLHEWVVADPVLWYRPYLLWVLSIVFVWWWQRGRESDEL